MRFGSERYDAKSSDDKDEIKRLADESRTQDNIIGLHEWDREITGQQIKDLEQQQEKLERQVGLDHLTGASSSQAFLDELEQSLKLISGEIKESRIGIERLKEISLIFMDLDHFKPINDTLGHEAGDEVLKRVVEILRGVLRGTDMLARLGGDEFVALLPNTNEEHAMVAAEKMRISLADDPELKKLKVTASLGVSSMNESTVVDLKTLLKRADAANYASKEAGRNQVAAYKEDMKMRNRNVA